MLFFETTCFEFPCVAGAHFPEVGGSFSRSRWLIFPKSAAHFPKVGGSLSQSRWLIFPKSVADFPKVGGSFSRSRWLIFSKSVTDFPKIGRFPDGLCQIGGRFFQVGKVCSVASICMGFGKAKGSLWTWWHTSFRGSVKKQKNVRTWRTAEISLFACSALQQLESRNCSAETFEIVHDRQIHTTMIQSLHFTHWVASCLLILMCIGVCHTWLSTFFTHSSHHYLEFLLIRSNIEDCSLAYVICTCKFWFAAWDVSELNPHSQELLHLSLWFRRV